MGAAVSLGEDDEDGLEGDAFADHLGECDVCCNATLRGWGVETYCGVGRAMAPDWTEA